MTDTLNNLSPVLEIVQLALRKNAAFCVYHLPTPTPSEIKLCLVKPEWVKKISERSSIFENKEGFVVAPFDNTQDSVYFENNWGSEREEEQLAYLNSLPDDSEFATDEVYHSTTQKEYFENLHTLLDAIEEGKVSKVVLSKILAKEKPDTFNEVSYFQKLVDLYPRAFCYLLNLPGEGRWTGASPEIILKRNFDSLQTVALAGTQLKNPQKEYTWAEKEIKEQEIVIEGIRQTLDSTGFTLYREEGPRNAGAGKIVHLKNYFHIYAGADAKMGDLLYKLHPTPAVAGLPQQQSIDLINAVEKHDRKLYAGFLGPLNTKKDFDFFVNLRCMQITPSQLVLYLGGGITADSDPESEWQETELKSRTLLNVLEII